MQSGDSARDSHLFGRTAVKTERYEWKRLRQGYIQACFSSTIIVTVVLYERDRRVAVKEKTVLETYEEKRQLVQEFNLTSDLFASKVFEDIRACQELCRLLLRDQSVVLQNVKTQYVIRNLETHSMELDILAERNNGNVIGIEIQMYEEEAPFKRTRYYLSGIDMSILEKGQDYYKLPAVTMVCLTKEDIIGDGRGSYIIERKVDSQENTVGNGSKQKNTRNISNGIKERYYNLEYRTGDDKIDELLAYFKDSDPYYRTETFPRIVERVRHFKVHKKGVDIMCAIADRIRNEGKAESRIEDIIELLEELGKVPQRIIELIKAEDNLGVLSRWHKSAARASSFAEFEANM